MSIRNGMMTVGEAARAVGVASSALRYYEKQSLLTPSQRSASGYRLYNLADLDRLRFIRAAQAIGFTLEDIRMLLEVETASAKVCREQIQPLIERRLADVDKRLIDLKEVRAMLLQASDLCRSSKGKCLLLNDLQKPKAKRKRR